MTKRRAQVSVASIRRRLDRVAVEAATADQDGNQIEHLNHEVLVTAHELGRALAARKI